MEYYQCNYCLCVLPLLLLALESLVCLVHPFFPVRERKKAGGERDNDYFTQLDSSDCLTVAPLGPLDPAAPLDPCIQGCSTLFNLSSLVVTGFSLHLPSISSCPPCCSGQSHGALAPHPTLGPLYPSESRFTLQDTNKME